MFVLVCFFFEYYAKNDFGLYKKTKPFFSYIIIKKASNYWKKNGNKLKKKKTIKSDRRVIEKSYLIHNRSIKISINNNFLEQIEIGFSHGSN